MGVKKKVSLIIFTVSLLLGCTSSQDIHQPAVSSVPRSPPTDPAESQLAEAASSVSKSLISLAENQQAATPLPKNYTPPDPSYYGMSNKISINWSGPIEPLLQQIADATGYHVKVLGKEPAVAILVTVVAKDKPIGDVLRNAGYQVTNKANIVVFPRTKIIELRYVNN